MSIKHVMFEIDVIFQTKYSKKNLIFFNPEYANSLLGVILTLQIEKER